MIMDFQLDGSHSLKEKRRIVQSLKTRLRSRYNVSICESDCQDLWQKGQLTLVSVGTGKEIVANLFSRVEDFINSTYDLRILQLHFDFVK